MRSPRSGCCSRHARTARIPSTRSPRSWTERSRNRTRIPRTSWLGVRCSTRGQSSHRTHWSRCRYCSSRRHSSCRSFQSTVQSNLRIRCIHPGPGSTRRSNHSCRDRRRRCNIHHRLHHRSTACVRRHPRQSCHKSSRRREHRGTLHRSRSRAHHGSIPAGSMTAGSQGSCSTSRLGRNHG